MDKELPVSAWAEWKIIEKIGEGSFGSVFKAQRCERGKTFYSAIKIITIPGSQSELNSVRAEIGDEHSVREYFRNMVEECIQEVGTMEYFRGNSYVVSVEDFKVVEYLDALGWEISIRMEYLTSFIDYCSEKQLTEKEVIQLGLDLSKALEYCRKLKIIHRDIKPENIFVSRFGDYKLGDFGIARELERTMSGLSKKGTYSYMAPEMYKGERYDSRVDIYSLGIVLYKLMNRNRLPFLNLDKQFITYRDKENALTRRMSGEAMKKPVDAGDAFAEIILKACAFDPKDRYQTPEEFHRDLDDLKNGRLQKREEDRQTGRIAAEAQIVRSTAEAYDADREEAVRRYVEQRRAEQRRAEQRKEELERIDRGRTGRGIADQRASYRKNAEQGSAERRAAEQNTAEPGNAGRITAEQKAADRRASDQRHIEQGNTKQRPAEQRMSEVQPSGQRPAEYRRTEQKSADTIHAEKAGMPSKVSEDRAVRQEHSSQAARERYSIPEERQRETAQRRQSSMMAERRKKKKRMFRLELALFSAAILMLVLLGVYAKFRRDHNADSDGYTLEDRLEHGSSKKAEDEMTASIETIKERATTIVESLETYDWVGVEGDRIRYFNHDNGEYMKVLVYPARSEDGMYEEYYYWDEKLFFAYIWYDTKAELYYYNDDGELIRWIDDQEICHDNETENPEYAERGEKYWNRSVEELK